ncbi:unnamed protein product, partial [Vitis vinifera]|uniref:Myb-like domain-containing protein n=1 Tax=Vitis vinifera TaxID=29760 RepID=D7SPW4_VITVI
MAKKHNLGIATDWTAVEQSVLEEVLSAFASESNIIWYAKIAMQLQSEMEWDAALQCRRMSVRFTIFIFLPQILIILLLAKSYL